MRHLLLFVLLSLSTSFVSYAQFYTDLGDNTGFNIEEYHDALNSASQELVEAFPGEYPDSFRVYSTGFYLHSGDFIDGYPGAFERAIDTANTKSKYYLLIGRQSDETGLYRKFWVKSELPTSWLGQCFDDAFIHRIETEIKVKFSDLQGQISEPTDFSNIEIEGISFVTAKIIELNCCEPEERSSESCNGCISSNDVYDELSLLGFIAYYNCEIISADTITDHECVCDPINMINSNIISSRLPNSIIDNANYSIIMDGDEYSLYDELIPLLDDFDDFNGLITRNIDFCDPQAIENYNTSFESYSNAVWIHIWENPINPKSDVVLIRYKLNTPEQELDEDDAFVETQIQASVAFRYQIVQRCFAPWDRFGHLPILPGVHLARNHFHGDNRGFALEDPVMFPEESNGVTARLNHIVDFNLQGVLFNFDRFCSVTRGYRNFVKKLPATDYNDETFLPESELVGVAKGWETVTTKSKGVNVGMFVEGSNPLVHPIHPSIDWFTPDLENLLYTNFYFIPEESSLHIHASIKTRGFPAYELFIEDACQNKVFLHTATSPCESDLAVELLNPGLDYQAFADFKVPVSSSGCFTGNIIELLVDRELNTESIGSTYSIANWNSDQLTKYPAIDCLAIPCEGAYPNNGENLEEFYNCNGN